MIRRFAPWFGPLCALGLLLFCYRSVLFEGKQFGYRDAAHYYYPLQQKVQAEWHAGRVPLWDPSENAGMPLLGNPTAAVFYPIKVVFALFSFAWAVRIYTLVHTALAFAGTCVLLRGWRASRSGASLAGLSFAFGAPVLFQYCNIIYLVGAAWIPWGLWAVDRWLRRRQGAGLLVLAVVLAMQVLGGEPQSAYLIGLAAGAYALILTRERPARARPRRRWAWAVAIPLVLGAWIGLGLAAAVWLPGFRPGPLESTWAPFERWLRSGHVPRFDPASFPGPVSGVAWAGLVGPAVLTGWAIVGLVGLQRYRRFGASGAPLVPLLAGLVAAATLAGLLAAIQLLPVAEFTRISARATLEGPHDYLPFSLEPYRLVELLWPGFFGRTFGGSVAWLGAILPQVNHKIWCPSLYLGALTLIFAAAALGRDRRTSTSGTDPRPPSPWRPWLVGIAAVSLVGSFGEFASPVWAARFSPPLLPLIGPHDARQTNAVRLDGFVRDGDASPYALMATFLPGFDQFRYPSKLFTFAALALAGLAGLGWDRIVGGETRRARRFAALGLLASLLGGALVVAGRSTLVSWFEAGRITTLFGPLDVPQAVNDLGLAFAQGGGLCALALVLIGLSRRRPELAGGLAVLAMALDLGWANASIVRAIPQADFEVEPALVARIAEAERADPGPGPYRVYRVPSWNPPGLLDTESADRIRDLDHWERNTIQPKYGINHGIEFSKTIGVAELYDYEWFFAPFMRRTTPEAAQSLGITPGDEVVVYPRRGVDLWNSRYFILPYIPRWDDPDRGFATFLPETTRIYPAPDAFRGPGGPEAEQRWAREQDVQVVRNRTAYPRAWIVHDVRFKPPVVGLNRRERKETVEEILFSNEPFWRDATRTVFNPRKLAWIETDDQASLNGFLAGGDPTPAEVVRVVAAEPDRVILDATLERPGLVILADVFYPGWELTIDDRPAPIHRANRMMRGASVASGRHRLVYTYRPGSFRVGAVMSGVGLLALLVATWWQVRRRPEK